PASFEPAIDYCVVKFPRWAFEKFPEADQTLTTQMKSVGEAMAIGRTFKEALQTAVRSLEQDRWGLVMDPAPADVESLKQKIRIPTAERCFALAEGYRRGMSTQEMHELSAIDPWFLENIREIVLFEETIRGAGLEQPDVLRRAKQMGFADRRIAELVGGSEAEVRAARLRAGIRATFKMVDTCAAEFEAHTPYLYSTYEEEDEAPPTPREKVVILGSGPNRIGQGIEFDYACVHAELGLQQAPGSTARSYEEAERIAQSIGYPVLVRPSYVLGGRAMQIVYDREDLQRYMTEAVRVSPEHPILVDKFLEDALEIDVDAIADGERVVVGGVMEHVEKAGIHSGDSACALPPYSLGDDQIDRIKAQTRALAKELGVLG